MGFVLKQIEVGPMQNFCYLIGDQKAKQALLVDPAWSSQKILDAAESEGFKLAGFIITARTAQRDIQIDRTESTA